MACPSENEIARLVLGLPCFDFLLRWLSLDARQATALPAMIPAALAVEAGSLWSVIWYRRCCWFSRACRRSVRRFPILQTALQPPKLRTHARFPDSLFCVLGHAHRIT